MSPEDRGRLLAGLSSLDEIDGDVADIARQLLRTLDAIADVVEATRDKARATAALSYVDRARAFAEIAAIVDGVLPSEPPRVVVHWPEEPEARADIERKLQHIATAPIGQLCDVLDEPRRRSARDTEPLDFDLVAETEKRARALKGAP